MIDQDEPVFASIIQDMFPGLSIPIQEYDQLQKYIQNATINLSILNQPEWNVKVIQVINIFKFQITILYPHNLWRLSEFGCI